MAATVDTTTTYTIDNVLTRKKKTTTKLNTHNEQGNNAWQSGETIALERRDKSPSSSFYLFMKST